MALSFNTKIADDYTIELTIDDTKVAFVADYLPVARLKYAETLNNVKDLNVRLVTMTIKEWPVDAECSVNNKVDFFTRNPTLTDALIDAIFLKAQTFRTV